MKTRVVRPLASVPLIWINSIRSGGTDNEVYDWYILPSPLEHTVLWTDTTALAEASGGEGNIYQSYTSLSVPPDLIAVSYTHLTLPTICSV